MSNVDASRTAFADIILARRVASRFVSAADYNEYVQRKKREHEKPLGRKEWEARIEGKGKDEKPQKSKKPSLKDRLKSLSSKAVGFLKSAPSQIKKFVEDPKHRKEVLSGAADAIKKAPGKLAKNAVAAAKKEMHEFKEAGQGIAAVLKGGKMSPKQKKALKTVALDVAMTVAVTALTSGLGSSFAGAAKATGASFVKALGKRIALNAVTRGLGNVVTLEEAAHGMAAFMAKMAAEGKSTKPDDVLGIWVESLVAKELEGLSDDDLVASLEETDSE